MLSSNPHDLKQDDQFKAIKTDIIFKITNHILPVIYWHKLRQKMLAFVEAKGPAHSESEEKKLHSVSCGVARETPLSPTRTLSSKNLENPITESPPPSPTRTFSDASETITLEDFLENTKTPEAFLNYFKFLNYTKTDKLIEDFLLDLFSKEKSDATEGDAQPYLALQEYFKENLKPYQRTTSEKKSPAPEEKIHALATVFKSVKNNKRFSSIKEKIDQLTPSFLESEATTHISDRVIDSIYDDFKKIREENRKRLDNAIANQLGFHLRPSIEPPATLHYFNQTQSDYLKKWVNLEETKEENKEENKEDSKEDEYPARLKKIIQTKQINIKKHLHVLMKLKKELTFRSEGDQITIKNTATATNPATENIINFWFPEKLVKKDDVVSLQTSLAWVSSMEETLLLYLETSPFTAENELATNEFYSVAINRCNAIRNKNIKELLLKLIREDLHSLNLEFDDISEFLGSIYILSDTIINHKRKNESYFSTDPAGISTIIQSLKELFKHNRSALDYFEDLFWSINQELNTIEPSFEQPNSIIDDDKKSIISYGPKPIGNNDGFNLILKNGMVYTAKQGTRFNVISTKISIGKTSAEIASFHLMQSSNLDTKSIAPAYFLIKDSKKDKPSNSPSVQKIVRPVRAISSGTTTSSPKDDDTLPENKLDPIDREKRVIAGLEKHFYAASEWSTDYLSIKGCSIVGFDERKYFAGTLYSEIFEALRDINAGLQLGLENVFFGSVFSNDFDAHLENFELVIDIKKVNSHLLAYVLYLIRDIKKFVELNKITPNTKESYTKTFVSKFKKIKQFGGQGYFRKYDHDSGLYLFYDLGRSINLSRHPFWTLPGTFRRRWGMVAHPTCHLTEFLVGQNPNHLLLSDKSIHIMSANGIHAQLSNNMSALNTYFEKINELVENSHALQAYGNPQQILYVLLDKFYAHLTGEMTQLPPEFNSDDQAPLGKINENLKKTIKNKVTEATLHRTYDLQRQFYTIVEQASQQLAVDKKRQLNESYFAKQKQYSDFKKFLKRDMFVNRVELLYYHWEQIHKTYDQKKRRSSDASSGLLIQVNTIYARAAKEKDLFVKQQLKYKAYLITERYLQANSNRLISRTLAATILNVTHSSKNAPFFRMKSMNSVDPLQKDKLIDFIFGHLRAIKNKMDNKQPFQTLYKDILAVLGLLIEVYELPDDEKKSTPTELIRRLKKLYNKWAFEPPQSEETLNFYLCDLNQAFTHKEEHETDNGILIKNFISNVAKLEIISQIKKKIYQEKNETLAQVLPKITENYRSRIGFFQSEASRDLLEIISKNAKNEEDHYKAIASYLSVPENRQRTLGKTILNFTGWYHPADFSPAKKFEFKV